MGCPAAGQGEVESFKREVEIQLARFLRWHGPGSRVTFLLRREGTDAEDYMCSCDDPAEVRALIDRIIARRPE